MRLYDFLLKYRSMVIALAVVTLLGVGLFMHLKSPIKKKPPRPSPAPSAAIQVKVHRQPESAVESRSNNRQPKLESVSESNNSSSPRNRVSPRPQAFHPVETRVGPAQDATGKGVPVIVERRSSAIVIMQSAKAEQRSDSGVEIQAEVDRSAPREAVAAESDDEMPFFAPPAPPEGGLNALIEGTPQSNMKEALVGYIRTYYPLVTLDAESIELLNVQGKAEYARQKAALDKELSDSVRGSIFPTPGDIPNTLPQELIDTLRAEDPIENQPR